MRSMKHPRQPNGQSLAEYGLIAATISVVALTGLIMLGNRLSGLWTGFGNALVRPPQQVAVASPSAAPPAGSLTGTSGSSVVDSAGQVVDTSIATAPLSKQILTLGANGTTDLLADEISNYAKKLVADGKITQSQADTLLKLANAGHAMGDVEEILSNTAKQSGTDTKKLMNSKVMYNGKQVVVSDLVWQVASGATPSDMEKDALSVMSHGPGKGVQDFMGFYQQAQKDGTLSDPVIKAFIDDKVKQILYLGELSEHYTNPGDMDPSQYDPSMYVQLMASRATHYDSQAICNAGGYTDQGTACVH